MIPPVGMDVWAERVARRQDGVGLGAPLVGRLGAIDRAVMFGLMLMLALGATLAFPAEAGAIELTEAQIQNRRCLNCHGQKRMAEMRPGERASMVAPASGGAAASAPAASSPASSPSTSPGGGVAGGVPGAPEVRPGLYLGQDVLAKSVHREQSCTDCHPGAKTLPHVANLGPASCAKSCHAQANGAFIQGAHADAIARRVPDAPTCGTCHGSHEILSHKDRKSRTFPLNVIKTCGDCHAKHAQPTPAGHDSGKHVQDYLDSVHGKAVVKSGLIVAATCVDCHGSHEVRSAEDPRSMVHRARVPETCGRCHDGVVQTYAGSIHGRKLADGSAAAPVCSDCHASHAISRISAPGFVRDIVNECGDCHDKHRGSVPRVSSLYDTYRRSYHGQVNQLGSSRAARCSDCHGAHDILPIAEPASRLSAQNKLATCQKCHPDAQAGFVSFEAHADYRDVRNHPLLHYIWLYFILVMGGTFTFFGLHCVAWFVRNVIDRIRHGKPKPLKNPQAVVRRFTPIDRFNHALVIISFFGLALTGMPLLFSSQGWARTLANLFGGAYYAGIFHRFFGVMLLANFAIHIGALLVRIVKQGPREIIFGPNTMLLRWRDLTDALGMLRWFFVGGHKPRFDRWTYWEKFDYAAEIFGSTVIGFSGLMLWFPGFFSGFMPGWTFNVATLVHGYEALLAVGFIFTIHFYNAHLRLEKFPVDDVMFTGSLPVEELEHERGAEYDRLVASGKLETLRVTPPAPWMRKVAVAAGVMAMIIGTAIVVLIIIGGLSAL